MHNPFALLSFGIGINVRNLLMPCLDETSGGCQKLQWLLWWQLTWVRRASPASRHRSDHPRADPLSRYPGLLEIEKKWGGRSFQYLRDLQASLGLFAGSPGCATSTYARPFAEAAQHAKRALLGTPFAVNVLFERRANVSSRYVVCRCGFLLRPIAVSEFAGGMVIQEHYARRPNVAVGGDSPRCATACYCVLSSHTRM